MIIELANKLKVCVGVGLILLANSYSQSQTVRVGPNGKLIKETDNKKRGIDDGKLQDAYTSGGDSLYKSKIDESSLSFGNDLLKKCGESNSNADECLIKFKNSNLEFSGTIKDSKKGFTTIELDNNELVDVTAKEYRYFPNGASVKFTGKIKLIGSGYYVHHSVIDAEFQ